MEKGFRTSVRFPTLPPSRGGWLCMKVSKLSPSGRILTKLWISETAWSIGKSLYNGAQGISSREDGRRVETSTNDSSSKPSFLHLSASQNVDQVRSYRMCRTCGDVVVRFPPTEAKKVHAHKRGDVNRLTETRFPARANQIAPTNPFHLLPRGVLWSPGNPKELANDFPRQNVGRYPQ